MGDAYVLQSLPIHVCECEACVRQRARLHRDEMETWTEFQWLRTTAKIPVHLNAIALRVRNKMVPQICRLKRKIHLEWKANVNLQQKNCDRVRVLWKIPFHWPLLQLASTWYVICMRFVAPICFFPHLIESHRRWSEVLLFDTDFLTTEKHGTRA